MKTKQELLEIMARHGACLDARRFVIDHPSNDAEIIGVSSNNREWLMWLLGRERRLVRFARVAAECCEEYLPGSERAVRAASVASYAAAYAADAAAYAYAAYAAAAYAAYAAAYAAAAYAAYAPAAPAAQVREREAQLVGLKRIWQEWCAGLPAEK